MDRIRRIKNNKGFDAWRASSLASMNDPFDPILPFDPQTVWPSLPGLSFVKLGSSPD
jgi:hypothetical protein